MSCARPASRRIVGRCPQRDLPPSRPSRPPHVAIRGGSTSTAVPLKGESVFLTLDPTTRRMTLDALVRLNCPGPAEPPTDVVRNGERPGNSAPPAPGPHVRAAAQ